MEKHQRDKYIMADPRTLRLITNDFKAQISFTPVSTKRGVLLWDGVPMDIPKFTDAVEFMTPLGYRYFFDSRMAMRVCAAVLQRVAKYGDDFEVLVYLLANTVVKEEELAPCGPPAPNCVKYYAAARKWSAIRA